METNSDASVLSRHRSTGLRLILFAWAVEILAAGVGLLIAGATGLSIAREFRLADGGLSPLAMTSVLLGALPFVMVAIVELTKIPLAVGFYHAPRLRWRLVFGAMILFLIFITFETALNGFERNFSNLTRSIQGQLTEVLSLESEAEILAQNILTADSTTIDAVNSRYDELAGDLEATRRRRIEEIERSISDRMGIAGAGRAVALEASINNLEIRFQQMVDELRGVRQEVREDYEAKVADLRADHEGRIADVRDTGRRDIVGLEERLRDVNRELEKMITAEQEELGPAVFTRPAIRAAWAERRAPLEAQRGAISNELMVVGPDQNGMVERLGDELDQALIEAEQKRDVDITKFETTSAREQADLQAELTRLGGQLAEAQGQTEETLGREVEILQQQKNDAQDQWISEKARLDEERVAALEAVDLAQNSVGNTQQTREEILRQTIAVRAEINDRVANNQIYRITALWTGQDDASKVSREELRITGLIWFGSLSLIVGITGTVLAFAGLVLMDEKAQEKKSTGPIGRSIRRALVSFRKRINKPRLVERETIVEKIVEVTKEVPVDRVVTQEVPREVIRKILVHVPLYTNDRSLLGDLGDDEDDKESKKT